MPNIQHNVLTGADLHEPKGTATATVDQVYVADGAAGGSFKTAYTHGVEDDAHAGGTQSLGNGFGNRTFLLNDQAGSGTTTVNRLPGRTGVWDQANDQFDFAAAGYGLGDIVTIRLDVDLITSGANRDIITGVELNMSPGTPFDLEFGVISRKSAGTLANYIVLFKFDLGSTDVLNNPSKLFMYSDNTGDTVQVNGWRVFMDPKNPVYN